MQQTGNTLLPSVPPPTQPQYLPQIQYLPQVQQLPQLSDDQRIRKKPPLQLTYIGPAETYPTLGFIETDHKSKL